MITYLHNKLYAFFGDKETPDTNKKIYNAFFAIISVSTVFAMLCIILYYVYAYAALYRGSAKFDWLLGIFSDFVVIMNFSLEESPYIVGDSSYPPIAIAMLYPFALICKEIFSQYEFSELTADELTAEVIAYPQFWIAMVLFFVLCSTLIVLLCAKLFEMGGKDILKLAITITFSAPFVFTAMRGNTIYFALIFLLIFLILKDSKNPTAREISYLCLALAGAIKIYPLFFGVFLLKEKKIFASVRVAVYFALIFGLSFFIFGKNFEYLSPFIDNLGGFMSDEVRLLAPNNLSISALLYKFLHIFIPRLDAESVVYSVIGLVAIILVFAISTYAAIGAKSNFSRYVICFAVVILIPTISYFYVIIFAILPLLEYIRSYTSLSLKKRVLYFFSFIFLFCTLFIFPKNFILHSFVILLLLSVEIASVFRERLYKAKSCGS
ncbi:MAG: DUF2029 domain-containing protein [Ruminococcaceae bacterium]|nr:DUF2029 domain-containing protein [Oscillospiraceae bacterium]